MIKDSYRKRLQTLFWLILITYFACISQNTYAASYQWISGADGWKLLTSGDYIRAQWMFVDGKWYYLDESGVMQTGWKQFDNAWYYLWPNGSMAIGWMLTQEANSCDWYYFDDSGAMATGWKEIAGDWYYFQTNGKMSANTTTPDGYRVNASGAWISKENQMRTSGSHFKSAGHTASAGGSSNQQNMNHQDVPKGNEQDDTAPGTAVPNPEPVVPEDMEPVASDSNAELALYLQKGVFLEDNDQTIIDNSMSNAISQKHSTVIFVSNTFYPYSQKLNRMEYKEVQKFILSRKQFKIKEKIYYITIYQLDYADLHKNTVQEYYAPRCQSWGYAITKCSDCGKRIEKVYLPPTGHSDTDSDLICNSCSTLMECTIGCKQLVRTNLATPFHTLEFTCIDSDYNGGMLFLSDAVIPYQAAIWFDDNDSKYTWSDARNWLNLSFYNGLSVANYIRPTRLPDIEDALPDKVFCLSKDEILSYAPWTMTPWKDQNSKFYWSRTEDGGGYVYAVHYTGHIASEVITSTEAGIRPAYILNKPKTVPVSSPIWLTGNKQLRQNHGEDYLFECVNPDYRTASGGRGALFYTDWLLPTTEAAEQWLENIENPFGISEFVPYIDEEGIHPGFIVEQN